MLKHFDVISDIHLDFWVKMDTDPRKTVKKMKEFIEKILPDEKLSNTLLIAGDLGHYNLQNATFLKEMREHYKNILLVFGNHDYYMISKKMIDKFKDDSLNRTKDMLEMAGKIEGVQYLNGNIVELDGIKFGGTGMWFDFSFGIQKHHCPISRQEYLYKEYMNDHYHMRGLPRQSLNMFWNEQNKLNGVIEGSDVIMTHYGPDWSKVPSDYMDNPTTSFYFFDGKPYFDKIKGKTWLFGHTHRHYDYMKHGCWFINNAFGYPKEFTKSRKIVNIPIEVEENVE